MLAQVEKLTGCLILAGVCNPVVVWQMQIAGVTYKWPTYISCCSISMKRHMSRQETQTQQCWKVDEPAWSDSLKGKNKTKQEPTDMLTALWGCIYGFSDALI